MVKCAELILRPACQLPALRALVEESTRGDPCSPLFVDDAVGAGHRGRAAPARAPVRQEHGQRLLEWWPYHGHPLGAHMHAGSWRGRTKWGDG